MNSIISMQDIRVSLASIADRAEKGETFTVIRNSRPAFRIEPIRGADGKGTEGHPLAELSRRIDDSEAFRSVGDGDIVRIVREVRDRYEAGKK
jgi:antitoxin (DNA-binding transcriptional repressor) of toxin-antitoxin stability system